MQRIKTASEVITVLHQYIDKCVSNIVQDDGNMTHFTSKIQEAVAPAFMVFQAWCQPGCLKSLLSSFSIAGKNNFTESLIMEFIQIGLFFATIHRLSKSLRPINLFIWFQEYTRKKISILFHPHLKKAYFLAHACFFYSATWRLELESLEEPGLIQRATNEANCCCC